MQPQVQAYLAERLATLRGISRHGNTLRETLTHVAGALEALRAAGALTDEEHLDWQTRAFEAAGIDAKHIAPARMASYVASQSAAVSTMRLSARAPSPPAAPPTPAEPPTPPRFLRLVPAPDEERDFFGGRLRFIGVEIYDTEAALIWRLAPLPDMALAMPEETQAFERDIAGLPEEELRRARLRRPNALQLANRFTVADDIGTQYTRRGGGGQGTDSVASGRIVVVPPPPPEARELRVDALGESFTIPIGRVGGG